MKPIEPVTSPTPSLELRSVVKAFGATTAVDEFDLTVDQEIIALVGPSGCGKSTLLRLVAGLLAIDRGTILIGDRIVDDGRHQIDPERRNIGLVFQDYALFPHLTTGKNVEFGLSRQRRKPSRERDRLLEMVGLAGYADRYPHELSGGERQRVALARALAPNPQVLLLDEPFANLDPNLRSQIRGEVVTLLRTANTPAVFVTHDQTEAMAVGDRIAVMRRGRIEQLGTPLEVFKRPRNQFVASFMGEVAFLPIHHDARGATTEIGRLDPSTKPEGAAVAAVRPDDIAFTCAADGTAEIVAREYRGLNWLCTLRLASGSEILAFQSRHQRAEIGMRVTPVLVPGHVPVAVTE